MKNQVISMSEVFSEIERYGRKKYAAGKAAAYYTAYKEAAAMLAEVSKTMDIKVVEEYVDQLEQVMALENEGSECHEY